MKGLISKGCHRALLLALVMQQGLGLGWSSPLALASEPAQYSNSPAQPDWTGSSTDPSAEARVEQQNTLLDLVAEFSTTATVIPASAPYIKSFEVNTSPGVAAQDSLTVDLDTQTVTLQKSSGATYTGTYDSGTKFASLTNPDLDPNARISLQFDVVGDTSLPYPDLSLRWMIYKNDSLQKTYRYSTTGQLDSYTIQNKDSSGSDAVGITRLANGRWQVDEQVYLAQDFSITVYTGFVDASDLTGLDEQSLNAHQTLARAAATSRTYFRWLGGIFAVISFKEGEVFKERLTASSTAAGIQYHVVVGEADYQSSETDDLLVLGTPDSFEALPGYTMDFGEWIEDGFVKGHGLTFTSPSGQTTVLDYPNEDLLHINVNGDNKILKVFVDQNHYLQIVDVTAEEIAAKKAAIAEAFSALDLNKTQLDNAIADLETRLEQLSLSEMQNELSAMFLQANQIKQSTENRSLLDAVSALTSQGVTALAGVPISEQAAAAQALADLKTAVQSDYAAALAQLNAAQAAQDYDALVQIESQLLGLSAHFDAADSSSLFTALAAPAAQTADLENAVQNASSVIGGLQDQMSGLFEGLTVPEKNKINTDGWEDAVYVTPDGLTMYFSYAPNNFYDYLVSGGVDPVTASGPDRDGHHTNSNPFENSDLYVSYWVNGQWSAPVNLGLNSSALESSVRVSADGNTLYTSKPVSDGSDQMALYAAHKNADGSWGGLQPLNIPTVSNEYSKSSPHMSDDGQTVYFTLTFDVGGQKNSDLYFSTRQTNGSWGVPQSLGAGINSGADETEIWVSSDQTSAYFTRGWELYSSQKVNGVWQAAVKLDFGDNVLGGDASLTADQSQIFFSMVDVVKKDRVIVTSFRLPDGTWSKPVPIEDVGKIPTTSLPAGHTFDVTSFVDLNAPATDFNKLILGSNTQWTDNGDELLIPGTLDLDPVMLAKAKAMSPTVLRYPGGELSDTYNWRNGIGTIAERTAVASQNTRSQPILFGTDEMLHFAQEVGAEAIFTVNIMTMTPQDAADWVEYVNVPQSRVKYWEIGNEPYLNASLTPEAYAAKVNAFIAAMKAVDPTIQFGVALRTSTMGASDYNERFLANVTEDFDYVTVHNAYFPLSFSGNPTEEELYEAAMAATVVIQKDFEYLNQLLESARPGQNIPIAVTEFNALFTVDNGVFDSSKTPSFTSALYVADVLASFAKTPNLLMANFWSLTGNGDFGAVSNTGETRPVYEVFTAYAELMRGDLVTLDTKTPVFENPSVGLVYDNQNAEAVTILATLEDDTLRVMAINKDLDNDGNLRLMLPAGKTIVSVRVKVISDNDLFGTSSEASWIEIPCSPSGDYLDLTLDPHSISFLEIEVS